MGSASVLSASTWCNWFPRRRSHHERRSGAGVSNAESSGARFSDPPKLDLRTQSSPARCQSATEFQDVHRNSSRVWHFGWMQSDVFLPATTRPRSPQSTLASATVAKPGAGTAFDRARELLGELKAAQLPMGPPATARTTHHWEESQPHWRKGRGHVRRRRPLLESKGQLRRAKKSTQE